MDKKFTKIIATIGPSSDTKEQIASLIKNGVNVIRFNFKHSELDWHKERIKRVKDVSLELKTPIGILLDLQGPEIRLTMPHDELELKVDEKIILSESVFETKEKGFSLSDPAIINNLLDEQTIIADDGLFVFIVKKEGDKVILVSKSEGILKNKKSINILGLDYDFPVIHDRDRKGLVLAKEEEIDFIALSFVRDGKDLDDLRKEMDQINLSAKIVSKIETQKALANIDGIIEKSDAVMIARGDLGVEIPAEEVPFYQKQIIKKCIEKGVPVITATQMLESMTSKPLATRAEISDVANAIYDNTDCVMLSGETASGRYPIEAVNTMKNVITFSEENNRVNDIRNVYEYDLSKNYQMICDSAFNLYKVLKARNENVKGFIIYTQGGNTARMISRYRPHVPIYAFCPTQRVTDSLTISYGVAPIMQESLKEKTEIIKDDISKSLTYLENNELAEKEDLFIILHGDYWRSNEGTSTIKIAKC